MTKVSEWLESQGLGRHSKQFAENSIDWDLLAKLAPDDLRELGLNVGERRRFLDAAALTSQTVDVHSAPSATEVPPQGGAERRQLTVMFCDLVGSTDLSGQLDPEDLRDVVLAYQKAAESAIQRFGGHVAQYLGDGLLVYFGYPRANEVDAQRAVHASLGIGQALHVLNQELEVKYGIRLAVRIGIHTGPVVVGEMGGVNRHENLAMGETPNLAARLQGLAQPGEIVISGNTRRLLGELFALTPLGAQNLKGISTVVEAFVVRGERATETRFAAGRGDSLGAMVGRQQELALLLDRWSQAVAGEGQMVVLTGEAGVGKSRLTSALIEAAMPEEHLQISYQCSPYHADTPLYPAVQQLTLAAGLEAGDLPSVQLDKLEAYLQDGPGEQSQVVPLLGTLLGLGEMAEARYGVAELAPQQRRTRTLYALLNGLSGRAVQQPVLFVLEDAHWIDPTTLALLELLLDRLEGNRMLVVVTARPTFEHAFGGHPSVSRVVLNRLGRTQVPEIVARITRGKTLPPELIENIAIRTDGVPLYVEEFTKAILSSGALRETEDAYVAVGPLNQIIIPSSLHDSLMARLDRFQPLKAVAQSAACIGREFDYTLIATITNRPADDLVEVLDQLVAAELIFRRGTPPEARYTFRHALVRDAAYESLLKSKRQEIHGLLLTALRDHEAVAPEILAHHAVESGKPAEATGYWEQAGDQAMARSAFLESVAHFERAVLSARRSGDDLPCRLRELDLVFKLLLSLQAGRGLAHPSVADTLSAADRLLETVGDTPHRFRILAARWAYKAAIGDPRSALQYTDGMEREASRTGDSSQQFIAHGFRAICRFWLGDFTAADADFEKAATLHDPNDDVRFIREYGVDQYIWLRCNWAISLMCRGEAQKSWQMAHELQGRVSQPEHVPTAGATWVLLALLHQIGHSIDREKIAQKSLDYSLTNGLTITERSSRFVLGGELHNQGRYADALVQLAENVDWLQEYGARIQLTYYLAFYASTLWPVGRHDEARERTNEVLTILNDSSVQWTAAEVHRILADAGYRDSGEPQPAIDQLRTAIAIADRQGAWLWKLRATNSLVRILAEQGDVAAAAALLADVIDAFPHGGRELPDYLAAKALHEELT